MSDVGEDDAAQSDWIREADDDSDSDNGGSLQRKYYSEYSSGGDLLEPDKAEPVQWTGSESDLKRQDSPIISNMEDYHAGPEFEEKCNNWMTGESGPEVGAHRSSSEIDHNENHLINMDYRGGEAFCDSDILSSDQSLSDYEPNENRWSSSESSRKNEGGHKKIIQEQTECSMPKASIPVFSRSAETSRAKLDQKQSAQRPDRFYARRQSARRRSVPGEQGVGQQTSSKGKSCFPIKIKCSKSCTTECEILKPGSEKNYPRPDRARFSSLYEEILRCDEFLFFNDEDDNGDDDDSDFGDDGPVSEITGLDTSDSKSESNRVGLSRTSARTESPEGSLRDGAVPGGKYNSLSVAEMSPLRLEEPLLSPILPVLHGKSHISLANAGRKSRNSNDSYETKELLTPHTPEKPSDRITKQESPTVIDQTLCKIPSILEKVINIKGSNEEARANSSSRLATIHLMSSLESSGASSILGSMLENAYLQTVKVFESTASLRDGEMKSSVQQSLTEDPKEARKATGDVSDVQPKGSDERNIKCIDECINSTCNNKHDDDGDCRQNIVNEKTCGDNASVDSMATKIEPADNVSLVVKSTGAEGAGFVQGDIAPCCKIPEDTQVADSIDTKTEPLVANNEADSAMRNPIASISRQYYMPFLNVLRSRKLINKRVRRPPQKFFKLLQAKSETLKVSERCSSAEFREATLIRDMSCKMSTKIFPKGREVPPGWKPGQYSTGPSTNAAATAETPAKRKHKKSSANKCKQHNKCHNNNKKRQVSSEASVQEVESEEYITARNARASYSSESSESTESKHTVGYGERYNPHSEDSSEMDNRGKKTFGQEFESKRQYYERLNNTRRKASNGGTMDKREITSQVNFLKTIDEFCTAEDMVNMEYDYSEEYVQPSDQSLDSVEYHISLAQYYSGRPSNLQILKGKPPSEPMASGSSGVRIRRAQTSIPSALDTERLKSLNVDEASKDGKSKLGMWSLNTLYAHKMSIAEVPRESNLKPLNPSGDGKEEAVDANPSVVRKTKTKHSRKRQIDKHKDNKLGKHRSVKTSHLEKLAVFESERKVTYLDLLKSGYNSKPYKNSKEITSIDAQNTTKDVAAVHKSKSCDASGNKCLYTPSQKEVSPLVEPEGSKRLKLVRFNEPKPLEEDKAADILDRSEEDTWCYSVNAMLLRANQALEQQKMTGTENNHHFPRPESAKVVAPVVKHMSSSFLSELLEQDKVEQKMVKQTQRMRRNEAPKASDDERQGKRNFNNNDNTEESKPQGNPCSVAPSTPNDAKSSCALTNVFPSIEQTNNDGIESAMHSAGILKIKASTSSKKPKDKQPRRDQKVFPGDCPASVYFSTTSTQPNLPPRKLLPLRYTAPVDVANQIGANVRTMKESLLQRAANDSLESKSQAYADKLVLAKAAAANVVTVPRYSRTDHRVSTIVQMFSDFNSNANAASSDGEEEDEEEDTAHTTIDAVHSPYVAHIREGNGTMVGPSRHLLENIVWSKACYDKLCSRLNPVSRSDDDDELIPSIESSFGNGTKRIPALNLTRGWDTSQFDYDERFDESAINISNLNYDVSNDPDALGLKAVMDILGQKQKSSMIAAPICSSQSSKVCVEDQGYHYRDNLDIKGLDRSAFIEAALCASDEILVSRNVARSDEIIEYCNVDRNNAKSPVHQESISFDRRNSLWDPNFTQECVLGEQLLVHRQNAKKNVQVKVNICDKDAQIEDHATLPENENEQKLLTSIDRSTVDTGETSYPEMLKESASPDSFGLVGEKAKPERGGPIITGSCFGIRGYHCLGGKKKQHQSLSKKHLERHPVQQTLSDTNASDSNEQWKLSEILSSSSQDKKSDEWHMENQEGLCHKTITESLHDFDWEKFKVPPPYLDRGDDIQGEESAQIFSRQSGYSTPTESSRQNMTDSEFSLAFAKRCDYKTMTYAATTQDSHTTEIIDGTETEGGNGDSVIKDGEIDQDSCAASQLTDLAGDDPLAMPLSETPTNHPCPENTIVTEHAFSTDVTGPVATKASTRKSIQVRERKMRTNTLGKLALTVVNSSCLVYKRLNAKQSGNYTLSPRYQSLDRNSLKLMRSCDLLQTVVQSKQRLWQCLQSLVRGVTFIPAFHIRSLHPPEMIPIVIQLNTCGSESMERHGTCEATDMVPVFYFKNGSSILESVFTVYHLESGLYGVITTDAASSVRQLPHTAESLTIGKLNLYRVDSELDLDKTRDVYLFGDEVATYDEALHRVTRIYDDAKSEKDVGVYFKMTCGWVPSQISADGRIMKTSCYCLNCVMMEKTKDMKGVRGEEADFTHEYRMYHNYCDMCGGCVATLPAMNKTKCKVDLSFKGWTVDQKGFAIPVNTKPVSKKKVLPALNLPKLISRKRFTLRNEKKDRKGPEQRCKSFSLPYVDSNATLSPRPTQSASSPNMYMDNWWWKEMEQIRQEEMEGFRQGNGAGENPSEVELVEYNEELRLKQKQRLQEIKAEMRMHRQSPASEQRELLDRVWSPPPPLQEDSAATQEPDDATTDTPLYNEDRMSSIFTKKAKGEDSVSQTHASAQTSNDILTKMPEKGFSYYFRNLNSQRKASWVRNYVEPPSRAPTELKAPKNTAPNLIRQRIPSKLPPVYKDTNLGSLTSRLSMKVKYRPTKMINAQKKKSKKKPRKSSSLSSTENSSYSIHSGSSSSLSGSDSLEGADFFENHKRKGWPTSIEDIFNRTLPLLRKNLSNSLRQDARMSRSMEDDDDFLGMMRTDQQSQRAAGPNEQGDAEGTRSEHSDLNSMLEYDMCDDADEMRRMWKLCFPEVNFWDKRRRSKKSRKRTVAAA